MGRAPMRRYLIRWSGWIVLYVLAAGAPCGEAGVPNKVPEPSLFSQIILKPTGQNGYEEFVAAADLVRQSAPRVDIAVGGTLKQKRAALADRNCARALELLRRGMQKPVVLPRTSVDWGTTGPELTHFRRLGRLLQVEQYVLFSQGRTRQATDSLY